MKFLLIFIGYTLGINFPDIDQKIKVLGHRSFLTHSPIITFVLYYFSKKQGYSEFIYMLIGFSFAIGIHLVFDLFPKKWTGGSIIKPFGGIMFSKVYIFLSAMISFMFSLSIAKDSFTYIYLGLLGLLPLYYYSKKEKKILRPAVLYLGTLIILGNFYFEGFNGTIAIFLQKVSSILRF